MRSLIISRWGVGHVNSGAALRNTQNMAALAKLGPVDVIVVNPEGELSPAELMDGVKMISHHTPAPPKHLPGRWLLPGPHHTIRRYTDLGLVKQLRGLSPDDYDLILVEEISLSAYVAAAAASGIRTVFDAHNVEARLWEDIGNKDGAPRSGLSALRQRMFNRKLHQAEAAAVNVADIVWTCSDVDAQLMERLYQPKAQVGVVPNAINVDSYADARNQRQAAATNAPSLIYIGTYSYAPNEVAALRLINDILPALRRTGLDLNLAIVGRDPTPAMQEAAAGDDAVTVTGAVDSIVPYLAQHSIAVMPITIGGGTRLKILEAFAAACPVISTAKGAEGINVRDGQNVLLAETTADFVSAIRQLADDPAACQRIGQGGLDTVSESYSWNAAAVAVQETLS